MNKIHKKTSQWVTIHQFKQIVCGGHKTLQQKLLKHIDDMPQAIKFTKHKNYDKTILVNIDYLEEICAMVNLVKKQDVLEKTVCFKSAVELSEFIVGGTEKIAKALSEWSTEIPAELDIIRICGKQHALCLDVKYIDFFIKQKHLVKKEYILSKTEDWLTENDLRKLCSGDIKTNLIKLQNTMPYAIQKRGSRQNLCLHKAFLKEFFQKSSGLVQRETIPEKTEEWKTATQLSKEYLCETETEIYAAMLKKMSKIPDVIQKRSIRQILCVNINQLDKFLKYTRFSRKSDFQRTTDEWKNTEELKGHYIQNMPESQIRFWLKYLYTKMPEAIQICLPKTGGKRSLCLNIKYLNEFITMINKEQQNIGFQKSTREISRQSKIMFHNFYKTKQK